MDLALSHNYSPIGEMVDDSQVRIMCDAANIRKRKRAIHKVERPEQCTKSITETIKKVKIPLSSNHIVLKNKGNEKVHNIKLSRLQTH